MIGILSFSVHNNLDAFLWFTASYLITMWSYCFIQNGKRMNSTITQIESVATPSGNSGHVAMHY